VGTGCTQGATRRLGRQLTKVHAFRWRKKYSGLMPSEMRRLKQLEEENQRLRRLAADLSLDEEMLQDALRRNVWSAPPPQA